MKIKIGSQSIGDGHPCFIIAEAGSNHNGSLEQARQLINVASEAGADAVKFQIFRAQRLYTKKAGMSDYLKLKKPIYEIISDMETPYEWLPILADYCRKKNILFLASVFDEESLEQLNPFVSAHKIASYEMTHLPLVRAVRDKGKPVLVSTGTAHLEEVKETVEEFKKTSNPLLALFQCTAAYPAPLSSLNVKTIPAMKEKFEVPVGLSDHSRDPIIGPMTAVACGGNLIEKHFTLNNELPGPDHRFALEPHELRLMVEKIRATEEALGNGVKAMHPIEEELRRFARRSIFSVRPIALGEAFSTKNLAVLRCGNVEAKLAPKHYPQILGKKAVRSIPPHTAIREEDFS